jgi:endonuclease III
VSAASALARPFASLLKKLRSKYDPEPYEPRDPITQLVLSYLQWEATRKQAEAALARIQTAVVDNNELRVSHVQEVIAMVGPGYPRCEERIARLHETMQEIYYREHAVSLDAVAGKNRKDLRTYVESLPGITPYVASHLLLTAFGVPVIPVDEKLASMLVAEHCAAEGEDTAHVAAHLERVVKADDALATHLLLQAWSDDRKGGKSSGSSRKPTAVKKKK